MCCERCQVHWKVARRLAREQRERDGSPATSTTTSTPGDQAKQRRRRRRFEPYAPLSNAQPPAASSRSLRPPTKRPQAHDIYIDINSLFADDSDAESVHQPKRSRRGEAEFAGSAPSTPSTVITIPQRYTHTTSSTKRRHTQRRPVSRRIIDELHRPMFVTSALALPSARKRKPVVRYTDEFLEAPSAPVSPPKPVSSQPKPVSSTLSAPRPKSSSSTSKKSSSSSSRHKRSRNDRRRRHSRRPVRSSVARLFEPNAFKDSLKF